MSAHQLKLVRIGIAALVCVAFAWACAATAFAAPFLYVSNQGSDNITPYSVAADGTLTAQPQVPAGESPLGTAATPDGRFLYVALNGPPDQVAGFAIAPDGALSAVPGSPFSTGLNPAAVAVGGEGKVLYVANFGADTISTFSIDQTTGALSPAGAPVATQDGPSAVALSPNGQFLFVPNFGSGSISVFSVGGGGALTPVAGSPFALGGTFQGDAVVAPDGAHLYTSRQLGNVINAFTIAPNGTLTAVAGSPFPALSPVALGFSSEGATLFSASKGSNLVQTFAVDPNGAIVAGPSSPAGSGPGGLTVGLDGKALFVNNSSGNSVSAYAVAGGALTAVAGSPFATGGSAPSARHNAFVDTDDEAAFELTGKAKQKVKLKGKKTKVKVKVTITANEGLTALSGGTLKGKGLKNAKLKSITSDLTTAQTLKLTLKGKGKKTGKKVAKLLGKKKKVTANVKVDGTDSLGNKQSRTLKVTLKGKSKKK